MSNGFGSVVDPGGPDQRFAKRAEQDQDMVDVIVNIDSFRYAQTGTLGAGGLVRWKVYRNGVPVNGFFVYPRRDWMPLVSETHKIPGIRGVTNWIQVILECGSGRVETEFGIEIDGKRPEEWVGVLVTDTGKPAAAKRAMKPKPSPKANR